MRSFLRPGRGTPSLAASLTLSALIFACNLASSSNLSASPSDGPAGVAPASSSDNSSSMNNPEPPASIATDPATTQQLLDRIRELEARVAALEAKESSPAPSPLPVENSNVLAAAPQALVPVLAPALPSPPPAPVAPAPAPDVNEVAPRLHLNEYADLGYQATDSNTVGNSFDIGSFDLFSTARLTEKTNVLGEVIFLAQPDNTIEPDLERLMFYYRQSDRFIFGMGRYHTDIGYYNATFHHIQWFATPIGRPLMFRFDDDGGFLPLQEVGLSINGNIPSGALNLHYVFEVGNGRDHTPDSEPAQNRVDSNHGKSVNINISAKPAKLSGLTTGFSFYHDDLTPPELPKTSQSIMDGYVVYQSRHFEWLNEGLLVTDAPKVGRTFHVPGFYTQPSYGFGKFRPYFRYAWENANDADPILSPAANDVTLTRQNDASGGIRIDLNSLAAFKFQYDNFAQRRASSYNAFSTQFSFSF